MFSILGERLHDARVLDLFAGSGTLGLEALSRGAREAVFVESDPRAARQIERSLAELGFGAAGRVVQGDAFASPAPQREAGGFDVVFIDPPFDLVERPEGYERCREAVAAFLDGPALRSGGVLVLRMPAGAPLFPSPVGADARRYGRSMVYFFRKPISPQSSRGGDGDA
jgi:16S rRNA (guanine(966)-N(2))-methyltransferase RsmD